MICSTTKLRTSWGHVMIRIRSKSFSKFLMRLTRSDRLWSCRMHRRRSRYKRCSRDSPIRCSRRHILALESCSLWKSTRTLSSKILLRLFTCKMHQLRDFLRRLSVSFSITVSEKLKWSRIYPISIRTRDRFEHSLWMATWEELLPRSTSRLRTRITTCFTSYLCKSSTKWGRISELAKLLLCSQTPKV